MQTDSLYCIHLYYIFHLIKFIMVKQLIKEHNTRMYIVMFALLNLKYFEDKN